MPPISDPRACLLRMEMLEALHRAARRGNVAACKAFLAHEPERILGQQSSQT